MNMLNRRLVLLAALVAAGCSSDPVPTDTYYRLERAAFAAKRDNGPIRGVVEVLPMRGEGVVNGRAILYQTSASQLQQYSYHFWADTPAAMVQRELVDALRAAGAFDTVALPEMRLNRDYEIMGTLRKLEHDLTSGSRAVIEIELSVRKVRGNTPLILKTYKAEVPVSGSEAGDAVKGFTTGIDQIFTEFVADLGGLPVEQPQ